MTKEWGYVIIEVDEMQHKSYDPNCDVMRDFDIASAVTMGSAHKLRIAHFNPDAFRVDGKTRYASKKNRISKLLEAIDEDEPEGFERIFLHYEMESGSTLPRVSASWEDAAKEVSRIYL